MNILVFAFLAFTVIYTGLQFFTLFLERRFLLTQVLLLGQVLSGSLICYLVIIEGLHLPWYAVVLISTWALIALFTLIVRFEWLPQLRVRDPKFITRQRVEVGLDHQEVLLITDDEVSLAGFHIKARSSEAKQKTVLLLSHGGFRSKNSFENMGLAQWLARDFDVISFDTRGHFESGGKWTGDGRTVLDLKAAVKYAKDEGYERIGVFGRSLGGWSAILYAAEHHDIHSLIILSAPLTHIRETPMIARIEILKSLPGRMLVRMTDGLRYHDYDESQTMSPMQIINKLEVPTFMIYGKKDPVVGLEEHQIIEAFSKLHGKKRLYIFEEEVHLPSSWHLGPIYSLAKEWFTETL